MDTGRVTTVTPPTPQLLKVVGLGKSSKGNFGKVPAATEVATTVKDTPVSSVTESKRREEHRVLRTRRKGRSLTLFTSTRF